MSVTRHNLNRNAGNNIADQLGYRLDKSIGVGTFLVYKNADQTSVASGTLLTFPAVDYDPAGWWNTSTNRWEPKQYGFYQISAVVEVSTAALVANKHHSIHMYKNGAEYAHLGHSQVTVNTDDVLLIGTVIVDAKPGDYFEVYYFHNQASDPTLRAAADHEHNFLCGHFIGYKGA